MKVRIKKMKATYAHPENGYDCQKERAKEVLELGKEYEVEYVEVHQSSTDVYLTEFKNPFNSVFFDFDEELEYTEIWENEYGVHCY